MHIYIAKNGSQVGPFSKEQLDGMLTSGLVSPSDLAWRDGVTDWQPLHTLLGLRQPPPIPAGRPQTFTPQSTVTPSAGPTGVGGWLVFYCVCLTILSPLFILGSMAIGWARTEPLFTLFPTLKNVLIWEYFGTIVLMIYGFVVGCMIWSGNPNGRSLARQFLQIRLFSYVGVEIVALLMMTNLSSDVVFGALGGMVGSLFQAVVYFLIWWFYFKNSTRVKNTYGQEPA